MKSSPELHICSSLFFFGFLAGIPSRGTFVCYSPYNCYFSRKWDNLNFHKTQAYAYVPLKSDVNKSLPKIVVIYLVIELKHILFLFFFSPFTHKPGIEKCYVLKIMNNYNKRIYASLYQVHSQICHLVMLVFLEFLHTLWELVCLDCMLLVKKSYLCVSIWCICYCIRTVVLITCSPIVVIPVISLYLLSIIYDSWLYLPSWIATLCWSAQINSTNSF